MDVWLVLGLGMLLPLIHLPLGLRVASWIFIALYPLYQYQKSMFVLVKLGGQNIQIPTLNKDIICLVLLVCLTIFILMRMKKLKDFPHFWFILFFGIWSIFLVVTGMLQGNGLGKTIMGLRPYVFYSVAGLLFGAFLLRTRHDINRLVNIILIATLIQAVIGLIHAYLDQNFIILESFRDIWNGKLTRWVTISGGRLRSMFGAANLPAYFMGLGIVASVWKMLSARDKLAQACLQIPLIIIFFWVIYLTKSRSAIVITALACFFMFILYGGRRSFKKMTFISLVIAAVSIYIISLTPMSERFKDLGKNPRLFIWAAFLFASISKMQYIFFGHGVGSLGRYGAETSSAQDVKVPELAGMMTGQKADEIYFVDNTFVRTIYEAGLSGVFFIVVLVGGFLVIAYKVLNNPDQETRIQESLPLSIAVYILVESFFMEGLMIYPWSFIFWLFFSYSLRSLESLRRTSGASGEQLSTGLI